MKLSQPKQININILPDDKFYYQEKINGIRAYWDGSHLLTRNGRIITCVPHIVDEIKAGLSHLEFDGELFTDSVSFQELNGMIRRKKADEATKQIKFHVFDLIENTPQSERILQLEQLPAMKNIKVVQSKLAPKSYAESFFRLVTSQGGEGIIARTTHDLYAAGVYKVKQCFDQEYTVVKLTSLGFTCKTEDGKEFDIISSGHGLKTGDRATIEYSALTKQGIPFHGRFKAIRYDINPPTIHHSQKKRDTPPPQNDNSGAFAMAILKAMIFIPLFIIMSIVGGIFMFISS